MENCFDYCHLSSLSLKQIVLSSLFNKHLLKEGMERVVHWIGIHLPKQGTWVCSLIGEDSTCHGATKPVYPKYWDHMPWSLGSSTRDATAMRSPRTTRKRSPSSLQLENQRTHSKKRHSRIKTLKSRRRRKGKARKEGGKKTRQADRFNSLPISSTVNF